jgi:trehalose 6-phosphate synthase
VSTTYPIGRSWARLPGSSQLGDVCRRTLGNRSLVLVSNRGPIEHIVTANGAIQTRRGSGGVVTALAGLCRSVPVTWLAAAMTEGDRRVARDPHLAPAEDGYPSLTCRLVDLPPKVYHQYYNVISNPLLWFLQHYMLDPASGLHVDAARRRAWENGYVAANRAFAEALKTIVDRQTAPPVVLLQDYQLYLVAGFARELGVRALLHHFVHIPWPTPHYWTFLPQDLRQAICAGLLANDSVGFQTPESARNFLETCAQFVPGASVDVDAGTIRVADHRCRAASYPISIDVAGLRRLADGKAVRSYQEALRPRFAQQTIVRVDRLEPSKNLVRGFEAYASLLERHPELIGQVKLVAFLVPSRARLAEYQRYRQSVQQVVEQIQGRFARPDWRPIEIFYENNYAQAIAGMALADVLLVNPFADGMNLVAKEGPIVSQRNVVLVLSEGAGAYHQLAGAALPVASGDVEGTAEALYTALTMPEIERAERLRKLRQAIEAEDLEWWARRQIEDLGQLIDRPSDREVLARGMVPLTALAGPARN